MIDGLIGGKAVRHGEQLCQRRRKEFVTAKVRAAGESNMMGAAFSDMPDES